MSGIGKITFQERVLSHTEGRRAGFTVERGFVQTILANGISPGWPPYFINRKR